MDNTALLEELGLKKRSYYALKRAGYHRVCDLLPLDCNKLLHIRQLGCVGLGNILYQLQKNGLVVPLDLPEDKKDAILFEMDRFQKEDEDLVRLQQFNYQQRLHYLDHEIAKAQKHLETLARYRRELYQNIINKEDSVDGQLSMDDICKTKQKTL